MRKPIVEGRRPVLEALRAGRNIEEIFIVKKSKGKIINQIQELAAKKGINIKWVEKTRIDDIALLDSHQGVAAFGKPYKYFSVEELFQEKEKANSLPFYLILDQIKDPQNLGSIIRSVEAAGVDGIIIPKKQSASITPGVIKASAGAVEHVSVAQANIAQSLDFFKKKGLWVVGTDVEGEQLYFEADFCIPVALVIGSEESGLRRLVREKCDNLVTIPMQGSINSLNVSNAAAVVMYEVLRQRFLNKEG